MRRRAIVPTAAGVPAASLDRRFYSQTKAFGRFGMRIFAPECMDRPHRHGHVEINDVRHGVLRYVVDGEAVSVGPDQMVVFWAGIAHQLVEVEASGSVPVELCNVYLPLDAFLLMTAIPKLQLTMLGGGMVSIPAELCGWPTLERWYADYRSGDGERIEVVKMELNALFRRMSLQPMQYARRSWRDGDDHSGLASAQMRHVLAMVRHVLENLEAQMTTEDVTKITGLHPNYALGLFSKTMQLSLKKFIIRMRLLRARALLLESNLAITSVAVESGFNSISQFYHHFSSAYGITPMQLRDSFAAKAKR